MKLTIEAKRIAAEFELTDDDVNKIGKEFIREMSAYTGQK
jgi:hypothetical protein